MLFFKMICYIITMVRAIILIDKQLRQINNEALKVDGCFDVNTS